MVTHDRFPAARAPQAGVPATDPALIPGIVESLRQAHRDGALASIDDRLDALARLRRAVIEEQDLLAAALADDLGKSPDEALLTEIGTVLTEIDDARRHLRAWLRPRRFEPGVLLAPSSGRIVREPLGTVLVIAPWNYPVNLALMPLVGAIAGGNTAAIKPSEVTPATSAALAQLVDRHLDPRWVRLVEGGVDETTALLAERWDLIFYTGNAHVGRIVAEAAAKHLTPTVLELGGKSPVFVDEGLSDAQLRVVARRIVWGKFTNAGQTCVAPDYLMGSRTTIDALTPHLLDAIDELYGPDPQASADYGRIVNARHVERLSALIEPEALEGARVVTGGAVDADAKHIAPTVLDDVPLDAPVMGQEIFGPILPMVEVDGPEDAVRIVRDGEKPLTAYVFTTRSRTEALFAGATSSGSLVLGMTLAQMGSTAMPFGGVGESGYGVYHGRAGVEAFTHAKPIVAKPLLPDSLALVRPPISSIARRGLRRWYGA